jgi:alpha-2-macroglobulin
MLKKWIIAILLVATGFSVFSQDVIRSRRTSPYTYIFRLTDDEMKSVAGKISVKIDTSWFHTLVDSFPTDSVYQGELPVGNYLRAHVRNDELRLMYLQVQPYYPVLLDNKVDLLLRLLDEHGEGIRDAEVLIGRKRMPFDTATQCYRLPKSGREGRLEVRYGGSVTWYSVVAQRTFPGLRYFLHKTADCPVVRYAWRPVRLVGGIPFDIIGSVISLYPRGAIYYLDRALENTACFFFKGSCYSSRQNFQSKHTGYMVFNKPMYQPGDTVMFKAYVIRRKSGKPAGREADVVLSTSDKPVTLMKLDQYRKGAWHGQFVLADSLPLKLDNHYSLFLKTPRRGKTYISNTFRYEDYVLTGLKLEAKPQSDKQYHGTEFRVDLKATDENNLSLKEGRFEILLTMNRLIRYLDQPAWIYDTIARFTEPLKPDRSTSVLLHDSLFPPVNLSYQLQVSLLTADNRKVTETAEITWYYSNRELVINLEEDSVFFAYEEDGIRHERTGRIYAGTFFREPELIYEGPLPYRMQYSPEISRYDLACEGLNKVQDLRYGFQSNVTCVVEQKGKKSIVIIRNPRNLPLTYFVYRKDKEIDRGVSSEGMVVLEYEHERNLSAVVNFLFAGKDDYVSGSPMLFDKTLFVQPIVPATVFPGYQTDIEVLVTDVNGKPVQGADVTAYGMTAKFKAPAPRIPGRIAKGHLRYARNRFTLDIPGRNRRDIRMDMPFWSRKAGLDTIEWFRFAYPGEGIYTGAVGHDRDITQVSPFIVKNGSIVRPLALYIDGRPVWFSWNTTDNPYAFSVREGMHRFRFVTHDAIVTYDGMVEARGQRTIFSADISNPTERITVKEIGKKERKAELAPLEKMIMICETRTAPVNRVSYLKQDDRIFKLGQPGGYYSTVITGPVQGGPMHWVIPDSAVSTFVYEPYYEYHLKSGLIIMKSQKPERYGRITWRSSTNTDGMLYKGVVTEDDMLQEDLAFRRNALRRAAPVRLLNRTGNSTGNLTAWVYLDGGSPLMYFLYHRDSGRWVAVSSAEIFTVQLIEPGYYDLFALTPGGGYARFDSLEVKPGCLSFYPLRMETLIMDDSLLQRFTGLYNTALKRGALSLQEAYDVLTGTRKTVSTRSLPAGYSGYLEGYVFTSTGEPVIFANIQIVGTSEGTVSNMEGYYRIALPYEKVDLKISMVGFHAVTLVGATPGRRDVWLEQTDLRLYSAYSAADVSYMPLSMIRGSRSNVPAMQGDFSSVTYYDGVRVTGADVYPSARLESVEIMAMSSKSSSWFFDNSPLRGDLVLEEFEAEEGDEGEVTGSFVSDPWQGMDITSSIRRNFSDYAFWQPALRTGADGKASFRVTFPDDVTGWATHYIAMGKRGRSGYASSLIRSYKPLLAQLNTPRFLVEGDTTRIVGSVANYTTDTLLLTRKFAVDGLDRFAEETRMRHSVVDTFQVTTGMGDSLWLKYSVHKPDGYFDGEMRGVPVVRKGMEEIIAGLHFLAKDSSVTLTFDPGKGDVTIQIMADLPAYLQEEVEKLTSYKYECNEQLASKLIGLLIGDQLAAGALQRARNDRQINRLLKALMDSRNSDGFWGWWKGSATSWWVTEHVVFAMTKAKNAGYKADLPVRVMTADLLWMLDMTDDLDNKLMILKTFQMMNPGVQQDVVTKVKAANPVLNLRQRFRLFEIDQLAGQRVLADSVLQYKHSTFTGSIWFGRDSLLGYPVSDELTSTLSAYRILGQCSGVPKEVLEGIRTWLLQYRSSSGYMNTYAHSLWLDAMAWGATSDQTGAIKPSVTVTLLSDERISPISPISEFPWKGTVPATETVSVRSASEQRVYVSVDQRIWVSDPASASNGFSVKSWFEGNLQTLTAGKEVTLVVEVVADKDASYVMIEVPIPAGCVYDTQKPSYGVETYREKYKESTVIFCEKLQQGKHTFTVSLLPRFTGSYTLNPAKVEMMYFPVFNGNTEAKRIGID